MTTLCIANCGIRDKHTPDCDDETCRGCLPRMAADGLRLCLLHTRLIAEDAVTAAELHAELEHALSSDGGMNERTSGSPDRTRLPNPRAVEARTEIRHTLVAWARLISEERGFQLPDDSVSAIGRYVSEYADWLAASDYAADASAELAHLVRMAYPVAYPSGARVFTLPAPCPYEGCGGAVKAILRRTDSLLPSALVCEQDAEHTWPADQWLTLGRMIRRAA